MIEQGQEYKPKESDRLVNEDIYKDEAPHSESSVLDLS